MSDELIDPPAGSGTGVLLLAGTPLGHPGDASRRLIAALGSAPVIAAEDTRRLRRLCQDLDVTPVGRVVSFFEANEAARVAGLLESLESGLDVLVVTDAGMPSVSDPGYRLVVAAVERGIRVTSLPGPSAVTTALALSGLAVDRFCFEGFLARKQGERRRQLEALAHEPRTLVFFEAPHRIEEVLADLASVFGAARPAALCRELTKTYEEVVRRPLGELAEWATAGVRGEITLVVAGYSPSDDAEALAASPEELARLVGVREEAGQPRKEAIAEVAKASGVAKRLVFDAVVAAKQR